MLFRSIIHIYIYIYIRILYGFSFLKNYIRNKKHHVRGGSIPCYGCMVPHSHKLVGPTNIYIYIYIYVKHKPHLGEHEILPSGTFIEPLLFKLSSHQSLHLCKTFSSLMCQWSEYTLIIYMYALIIYIRILYVFFKKKININIYI